MNGARREDQALVTGAGCFVTDVVAEHMHHAVFVRSVHPHARLKTVKTQAARAFPGVVGVLTGADLLGKVMPPINPLLADLTLQSDPLLPHEIVTWLGQPLAMVIATSLAAARDAAELIEIDYEPLPATVFEPIAKVQHGNGRELPSAFAAHVTLNNPQLAPVAMEPRAIVAAWQDDSLTVWLPTQAPTRAQADIARTLGVALAQVRVIAPDVGGAFGGKASVCPEDLVVALAAQRFHCNVKWVATRSEEFLSATQGRGGELSGSLTCDAHGHFVKMHAQLGFPLGGWLPFSAVVPLRNAARILPGPYVVPAIEIVGVAMRSHTAPLNIYRGAGRPEAALLIERLIDVAARTSGIDPVALRRQNLIAAHQMPYRTPTGETLDSGDYVALLDQACASFDYAERKADCARRRAAGERVGLGVAMYVEPCGTGWESARVTLHADGTATVASGSSAQGQGRSTAYALIAAQALGCTSADVTVLHGDTGTCPPGIGALASRGTPIGGSAVLEACQAARTRREAGEALPLTAEIHYTAPQEAWSAGCVMAQLAIDRDTGTPRIETIVWVDDAGRIIAPHLAEGQLIGGLAQGIGQALTEAIRYDENGQLLTGSLMDYAIPRAAHIARIEPLSLHSQPTDTNANSLGAKGVGEAGCIGVPAALLNAAHDALHEFGEVQLDFPLTAPRLWAVMQRLN